MRRSSVGKTLAGVTLALFALEAVSQSKDDALATVGDNSDEPSGWMRLEVAIFLDTSDETLASELWDIEPTLSYPSNRRFLTDYAEIKALMDEWGEDAIYIDTDGAIAVVPAPPPESDPTPRSEATGSPVEETETHTDSSQLVVSDSETLPLRFTDDDSQTLPASLDPVNAPGSDPTEKIIIESGIDHQGNGSSSLLRQAAIGEPATATTDSKTEDTSALENPLVQSANRQGQMYASDRTGGNGAFTAENLSENPEANRQQPRAAGKIPLESLQANSLQASNPESEMSIDALAVDAMATNTDGVQATFDAALLSEQSTDKSSVTDVVIAQSPENLGDLESPTAADESVNQDRSETQENTGDFFAIEGLGEDFNGLVNGGDNPARLPGGGLDTETIDWLSDFETEEPTGGAALDTEPTPPPLPASYQTMSLEMLPAGLKKLERETGRRPVSLLSWLQPIEGVSNPVIVDSWTDEGPIPNVQGTVRVSRAASDTDGYRLTADLWANTTATYLPKRLPAIEIPAVPIRVLLIEPEQTVSEELDEVRVEFIDISTGLSTVTPPPVQLEEPSSSVSLETSRPPLKHAIRLNETRDLREGYVRYIDHPVIQVAAVWRELTYAELYELGEAQRVRKDIDSLTRALLTEQSAKSPSRIGEQSPSPSQ